MTPGEFDELDRRIQAAALVRTKLANCQAMASAMKQASNSKLYASISFHSTQHPILTYSGSPTPNYVELPACDIVQTVVDSLYQQAEILRKELAEL